jgi:hypothetical protein
MKARDLWCRCALAAVLLTVWSARAEQQGSATTADAELVKLIAEQGGWAEAFAAFCARGSAVAAQTDRAQLVAWAERNSWATVEARMGADPALRSVFDQAKTAAAEDFAAHRFKTAFSCGVLPQEFHAAAHDPSVEHALAVAALRSGAEAQHAAPTAAAAPGTAAAPAVAATQAGAAEAIATPASPAGQLTQGLASFAVPAGWTVQRTDASATLLQRTTAHTRAVILVTTLPLSGGLPEAFSSAVRSHFPGTGLQLKYTHAGTTAAGSQEIYVLDTGKVGPRGQFENVAAVGVALGDRMQFAMLMNDDWGGESVQHRAAFEKLVEGWQLHGEAGSGWDPLHPPKPLTPLDGFFMGSRMQNQLNPLGGMDLLAIREYLLLLPTGQAYHGLPKGGHVLDMDFPTVCREQPLNCGTYTVDGSAVRLTWKGEYGLVTEERGTITRNSGGETVVSNVNGTNAVAVAPVEHLRIQGNYTATMAQSGGAGNSTSVVAQTFINFRADGTYQKSGFSSASFGGGGASGTVQSHRGVEAGTYTLDGYTLSLQPAGGQPPETFTAVIPVVNRSPDALFLDDRSFLRNGSY